MIRVQGAAHVAAWVAGTAAASVTIRPTDGADPIEFATATVNSDFGSLALVRWHGLGDLAQALRWECSQRGYGCGVETTSDGVAIIMRRLLRTRSLRR